MAWIDIKTQRPEKDGDYLVFTKMAFKHDSGIYRSEKVQMEEYEDGEFITENKLLKTKYARCVITHWMPLPDEPREGDNVEKKRGALPIFGVSVSVCSAPKFVRGRCKHFYKTRCEYDSDCSHKQTER